MKSDIADEDVNMDSDLERYKSAIDIKQGGPAVNGIDKKDSTLANGKGEVSV